MSRGSNRELQREKLERNQWKTRKKSKEDQGEIREKLERYGAMADGLTLTNKIASKSQQDLERDGAKPDGLTQTNEIASKSQREMELKLMA